MSVGNAHYIQFQTPFLHQPALLQTNLFDKASTHRTYSANKQVQDLVLGKEETIVYHVQRFPQQTCIHDKRDIGFRRTLRTNNHIDTVTSQGAEQLSGNTRSVAHAFAYDSHRSQTRFDAHGRHLSHFYFFGKLPVQHLSCQFGILIAHTYRSRVLRRGLGYQEHADSIFGQRTEDTVVHTDNSDHTQTGYIDKTGIINGRDSLNSLTARIRLMLDNGSGTFRLEGILYQNRNILMENRINSWRINHLRTEVTKLHSLYITQLVNSVSRTDNPRVSRHESVHIRPDFQALGIQCRSYNSSRIV